MTDRTCLIDGCGKPVDVRGWCRAHYRKWQRYGDPLAAKQIVGDDPARLLAYIQVGAPDECWPWTRSLNNRGYGSTRMAGHQMLAHRAAYTIFVEPIPDGLTIDHLCHKPGECQGRRDCPHRRCCNWISHLGVATSGDNTLRGGAITAVYAARDRCSNGHIYTEASSYLGRHGDRRCRICRRAYKRSESGRSEAVILQPADDFRGVLLGRVKRGADDSGQFAQ